MIYFCQKARNFMLSNEGGYSMNITEYEINEGTLAIISKRDGCSKIMEDKKSYIINNNSYHIIDHSCKFFGSSYNGRKDGARAIIGSSYKTPIIIEDTLNLVFFPTSSPEDDECIWVAVNKIKDYKELKFNTTKIIFKNDEELVIPLSYRAVQNQIFKATRLSYVLQNHHKMRY